MKRNPMIQKLEEIGENIIKTAENEDSTEESQVPQKSVGLSRGQKKRMKAKAKRKLEESHSTEANDAESQSESEEQTTSSLKKRRPNKLASFCDDLGLTEMLNRKRDLRLEATANDHHPGRSASSSRCPEVEVVVFENRAKRKKKVPQVDTKTESGQKRNEEPTNRPDFDFKKARHEVFKFGVSGMDKKDNQEAKIALAVSLGAKPPKNQAKNYKELIEEHKANKAKETEDKEGMKRFHVKSGVPSNGKSNKKKRDVNAVRGFDYQIGKYKDGVQFIDKKQLFSKK